MRCRRARIRNDRDLNLGRRSVSFGLDINFKDKDMYVPAHFDESRPEVLHELIAKNPLGILFTNGKSGLDANHIPFELDAKEGSKVVLHSHVARNNPVWQDIVSGDEVMVVFRAGDSYISP